MQLIVPSKLKIGDHVRIIAPSDSAVIINEQRRAIARSRLEELGLRVSFGKNIDVCDEIRSSPVQLRLEDLHEAYRDPDVHCIMSMIGGYNSNDLLRYIDWELVSRNPKIFCGYSDVTTLLCGIYTQTGCITYSGPHFPSFSQLKGFDYTLDYFKKSLFTSSPEAIEISPSIEWSDDQWWLDQEKRHFHKNKGWLMVNQGEGNGTILGTSFLTFALLKGSHYLPSLAGSVLFLEMDAAAQDTTPAIFSRLLESISHAEGFNQVRGIVFGRFPVKCAMNDALVLSVIKGKEHLKHIPIIANVDFGHTDPKVTIPIGGKVEFSFLSERQVIRFYKF